MEVIKATFANHFLRDMSRRMLVAVGQMTSGGNSVRNWEVCRGLVEKASVAGASFLALPEGFHFIGTHFSQSLAAAESLEGPTISKYRDLAREWNIWLSLGGFQETGPDAEHIYNSHVLIDAAGNISSVYRKVHLFDVEYAQGSILSESK
jgi:deaminated glutathione amidase